MGFLPLLGRTHFLTMSDLERFWSKVNKLEGKDACWLWTSQLRAGYGLFRYQGKIVSAHRFAYSLENKLDLNLQVCHSCDTPACVRPSHLFQGTARVNNNDKNTKDRHGFTLSNEQVLEMRSRPVTNTMVRDLADEFGVGRSLVKRALTGEAYSWVPNPIELPPQFTGYKLTAEDVAEILVELENAKWGTQTKLAKKYGVTRGTISHINTARVLYARPDTE